MAGALTHLLADPGNLGPYSLPSELANGPQSAAFWCAARAKDKLGHPQGAAGEGGKGFRLNLLKSGLCGLPWTKSHRVSGRMSSFAFSPRARW